MNNTFSLTSANWLDWAAIFGYLSICVFVTWRVLMTKRQSED